jgi:hypothetical protein
VHSYYQTVLSGNRLPELLEQAARRGVFWAACPYPVGQMNGWRLLATAALGEPGEHAVSVVNAVKIFASITASPGARISPGWRGPQLPATRRAD